MVIQLTQVYVNNMYKDNMYVSISNNNEIENLLYLKFYKNINKITVELLQTAEKEVIRKILLIEHIDKIIYRNENGIKEELDANRKLIVKMNGKEDKNLISDDVIIRFQQILDVDNDVAVVPTIYLLTDDLINILDKNNTKSIRIMDYGKNQYTIQQLKEIRETVKKYIEMVEIKQTKTEQFIELYTILSEKIKLDETEDSTGNIFDIVWNKTTINGFAEVLMYILNEMQVESKIIQGELLNGEKHDWNQVKIDYVWYNVDLALDVIKKSKNVELKYCLKSDEEFYKTHVALSNNVEICTQNSTYFIAREIEEKESFIVKLFKKVSNLISRKKVKKLDTGNSKI